MRRLAAGLILATLAACGGDSGGSSAPILAQVFLLDASGGTLSALPKGSKVMIDGEEVPLASVKVLDAPPADPAPAGPSNLTLYVPGYGGFDNPATNPAAGITVQLIKRDLLDGLFVFSPTPGRVLSADAAAFPTPASRTLCVQGLSKLNGSGALRFDVVLAVDRSGSTLRDSGTDVTGDGLSDTILTVQCESLRRYVDALRGAVKIGVIAFNGSVVTVQALTDDKAAAKAALDAIELGGGSGGTDFAQALLAAETLLTSDPNRTTLTVTLEDELGNEAPQTIDAPRMVIFCSDGVPTMPFGSNLTQEPGDRQASLDAARDAVDSAVVVNTVAFGPEAAISKLTTLPGIAAITGGVYIEGDDFLDLSSDPTIFGFSDVIGVQVWNATLQGPQDAAFSPDGIFERSIPWQYGNNDIHVKLLTREPSLSVETAFNVRVVLPANAGAEAVILSGALVPLTNSNLKTPDGKAVGGLTLKQILLNGPTAIYNDLVELKGMETFAALSANPVTVKVAAKYAGYESDFGWVEFDPAAPAATVKALLQNGNPVVLGNTGDFSSSDKFETYDSAAAAFTFSVALTPGKHYAFWTIPNGTLSDYLADVKTNAPLVSVSMYNPIRADHFLSFLSGNGRLGSTHGRTVVMALEDIATIDQSDRDFNDVVFSVLCPAGEFEPEFASPRCP